MRCSQVQFTLHLLVTSAINPVLHARAAILLIANHNDETKDDTCVTSN